MFRLERELKTDQEALTAFQRTNNLAILQEEGTISGAYLARLKTELSDLQLESRLLEATATEQESGPGKTNSSPYLLDSLRSSHRLRPVFLRRRGPPDRVQRGRTAQSRA